MAKARVQYVCSDCGAEFSKWHGQCHDCGAWNTIAELRIPVSSRRDGGRRGYAGVVDAEVQRLSEVSTSQQPRISTGTGELDRVLGGGLVAGSVTLLGGQPGAGKSTLLLQTLCALAARVPVLYVTGEESPAQIAMRAQRLQLPSDRLWLLAETDLDRLLATAARQQPAVLVVDSIQVMHHPEVSSAPGSVSQVRECAAALTRHAKQSGTILLLVGHVTKDGSLAGPKVLEHMVDCSILLEGSSDSRFRTLRSQKNRFGAVNELGVFAMTEQGLKEVRNPSAIFLSRGREAAAGSVVMVVWEGTRPLLVEIQGLVDGGSLGTPRRLAVGLEQNRLAMLLAILHRHGGLQVGDQDVFVNVVGGVKVLETSADLALLLAIVSSFRDRPLPRDLVVFGEVGLSGEIRPVPSGQQRLVEAAKHGFRRAIVPRDNAPRQPIDGMTVVPVSRLAEALEAVD